MIFKRVALLALSLALFSGSVSWADSSNPGYYDHAVDLYNSGRYSDATDAFDLAIKKKDRAKEASAFIDRIRQETVDRIRNRALTGISKANWQTKYYYMNAINDEVHIGISAQEIFERQSVNFRPGAIDALAQVADSISKADNLRVEVDLINEINQDTTPNPDLTAQQLAAVFSYLSLAARGNLPKY